MQNTTNGRTAAGQDPFFRSNPDGNPVNSGGYVTNWNTEAASDVGTIGSKDLGILQDEMHSEALIAKKCSVYADYFNDPELKSLARTAAEHHHGHFNALNNYLTRNS